MPPSGTGKDEKGGGPRSIGVKVARPRSRRHTRKFVVEYENEHDDEDDFQRSFSCRAAAPRSMKT